MAHTISWYIPGKVIYFRIVDAMSNEDLAEMSQAIADNLPSSGQFLHQIMDIRDMTKSPSIGMLRRFSPVSGERDGYVVVVGSINRMIDFLIITVSKFSNFRIITAATPEEAIAKLRIIDPSL